MLSAHLLGYSNISIESDGDTVESRYELPNPRRQKIDTISGFYCMLLAVHQHRTKLVVVGHRVYIHPFVLKFIELTGLG